jgi:multidrug efflux pump subunit AcrB
MSCSHVAVFIPLLMLGGLVGPMFWEFAMTVTVAIAVSTLVSLTLTPMIGARVLRQEHPEKRGRLSRGLEWCFEAIMASYDRALIVALRHRFITPTDWQGGSMPTSPLGRTANR